MFVRIEYMYGSKGDLHTDSYVREFPDETDVQQIFPQLQHYAYPVLRKGADPDKYVWPSAIISVSVCDERGYTKHDLERMRWWESGGGESESL